MTNAMKGDVTFEAAGRTWTLCYSVNALCALEEAIGGSAVALADTLSDVKNMRVDTLRSMFWAGLRDHHSETTIEDAGRLMNELGVYPAMAKACEALTAAFGAEAMDRPLVRNRAERRAGKRR